MKRKSAELMPVAKGELRGYGINFLTNARPGSMKILEAPSRYGNILVYPKNVVTGKRDEEIQTSGNT